MRDAQDPILSSFTVIFDDCDEFFFVKGRADNDSDQSTVTSRVAACAVLSTIGKLTNIFLWH